MAKNTKITVLEETIAVQQIWDNDRDFNITESRNIRNEKARMA
jgi:hypothetical protein